MSKRVFALTLSLIVLFAGLSYYLIARGSSKGRLPEPVRVDYYIKILDESGIIVFEEIDSYDPSGYKVINSNWNDFVGGKEYAVAQKYGVVKAEDVSIRPLGDNRSIAVEFLVTSKIWTEGGRHYADLLWFLNPNGLDLIEDDFIETRAGLFWNGTLGGVHSTIYILLPLQDKPYEAWGSPNGHCHGHIWWLSTPSSGF